jgi:hypothetical protein
MSSLDDLLKEAEEEQKREMDTQGLGEKFDAFRESVPNGRMDNRAVEDLFMWSQETEDAGERGMLQAISGGQEVGVGTTPPDTGPDGEGDSPDAAGEVSEGGDRPEADLDIWTPPEAATAENYRAPSTDEMTSTPEWMDYAKQLYKFKGEPEFRPGITPGAPNIYEGPPTDEDIAQWARREIQMFNWNVASTMTWAKDIMSRNDPQAAKAFLNLLNMYDHSDGGFFEAMTAVNAILMDPTTYVGLGVGSLASKGTAKAFAKQELKKAIQLGLQGTVAGATEGGALAGGFDIVKQNIEKEAGARQDIDLAQAGKATGFGMGLGMLLAGPMGYAVGRHLDKAKQAMDDAMMRIHGFKTEETRRKMQELPIDQVGELLRSMQMAQALVGVPDELPILAMKLLGIEDVAELPRLPDGELDVKAIEQILGRRSDDVAANEPFAGDTGPMGRGEGPDIEEPNWVEVGANQTGKLKLARVVEADVLDDPDVVDPDVVDSILREWADEFAYQIHDSLKAGVKPTTKAVKADEVFAMQRSIDHDPNFPDPMPGIYPEYKDKPILFEWDGKLHIIDGHHRFDKAADTGEAIEAYIFKDPQAPGGHRSNIEKSTARAPQKAVPDEESQALAQRILELDELEKGGVQLRAPGQRGSTIVYPHTGEEFELVGRTKNGWYKAVSRFTGQERNFRRNQFTVREAAPVPDRAGPMDLTPFSEQAARIIAMAEGVHGNETKLKEVNVTIKEIQSLAKDMEKAGIDIKEKDIATHWTPAELYYLRDTYNRMAHGMADLARNLASVMDNGGHLDDMALAYFNAAHVQFVSIRDLFYGVRGNAARMLRVLKERPKGADSYDWSQSILDTLQMQGGRRNTERAIKLMADYARRGNKGVGKPEGNIHQMSVKIWGEKLGQAILAVRYNMMLSSWRTHFFNFLGNSASGMYEHLLISPTRGAINNVAYVKDVALHHLKGSPKPDPATRYTLQTLASEWKGHRAAFRDSLALAKEIAMGRDIGEGKVWNELGLRYDVINVPDTAFGKLGTTPVRMLEAGDALFKNQYRSARIYYLADQKARSDEIHRGMDYETQFKYWVDNPDGSMEKEAREYAAKMTYTNDPNVYEGVLSAVARGAQSAQSSSLAVNFILPFVRTPANLLGYSLQMTGLDAVMAHKAFFNNILSSDHRVRQEAMAKLTVAAGLWAVVWDMVQDGDITGAGPTNWEERKAWEANGWQRNSIKVFGKYVDMSRAAPPGQSLTLMATIAEQLSILNIDEKEGMAWIGAALMAAADQLKDENYLSTVSDFIVAIDSKDEARWRSLGASTLNSLFIPNLARDFRRIADPVDRTMKSPDLMSQVVKQMKNAYPKLSEDLPPDRDWAGKPKNYFGNAFVRGILPFNVKEPTRQDKASMALAYANVPISTPPTRLDMPGTGNFIDLMAMDEGDGYVYDKYVQFVGESRREAVEKVVNHPKWQGLVDDDNIGPGSEGETMLRKAIAIGSKMGRAKMLEFLISHSGPNSTYDRGDGKQVTIVHRFSKDQYMEILKRVRRENQSVPEETPQYEIRERREGVEFFKP